MKNAPDIGFVYLATNKSMPGLVKIGMTGGDVQKRMSELSTTGVPTPFVCAYFCEVQNPAAVEQKLHKEFADFRESGDREFFRIDWRAVKAALRMMRQSDGAHISDSAQTNSDQAEKFTLVKWTKKGDSDKVRRILAEGGNPDQADNNRVTALMWAAQLESAEIAEILLDANADPDKIDKDGYTAMMYAACNPFAGANIVKMLINADADVNAEAKDDTTALMLAAAAGRSDAAKILLKADADHWQALICAAEEGHKEIVKMLLKAGVDPDDGCDDGDTALMRAHSRGHGDIVKILQDAQWRRRAR